MHRILIAEAGVQVGCIIRFKVSKTQPSRDERGECVTGSRFSPSGAIPKGAAGSR